MYIVFFIDSNDCRKKPNFLISIMSHDSQPSSPPCIRSSRRALSLAYSALFTGLGEEDRILLNRLLPVAAGTLDLALIMFSYAQGNREFILTFLTAILIDRHRLLLVILMA